MLQILYEDTALRYMNMINYLYTRKANSRRRQFLPRDSDLKINVVLRLVKGLSLVQENFNSWILMNVRGRSLPEA